MKPIIKYIAIIILTSVLASCQDDFDYRISGDIPEGTATVVAEVDFMPMAEALSEKSGSRAEGTMAPPGKGLDEIIDVCLLFYNKDGKLAYIRSQEDFLDYKVSSEDRTDDDADNGITAESQTRHASLKFDIPLGEYYIYAVANLGKQDGQDKPVTSTLEVLNSMLDSIQTRDGLKSIKCVWDPSNYRNNREMLGFFTDSKATSESAASRARTSAKIQSEPLIRIVTENVTIHSWLKRVASKVTIEFDASGLRDHVSIYIHKATIHHLPKSAKLGKSSKVEDKEDLILDGNHRIVYGLGDNPKQDYKNWPCLTRNNPTITSVAEGATLPSHAEDAYALYFYENEQGTYPDNPIYDKRQYPSVNGTVKDKEDICDLIYNGTYIEVEGYYVGSSSSNQSEGTIKYRFMLGQDTKFDYNATRNCHYKLTMHFRGNANDVDWHIEYDEDVPSIFSPDIYYISYLYNREM